MPQLMAHDSARVLEFDSLRELLRSYASSSLGQAKISFLAASTERDWIEQQQQLTEEIREFRRGGGRFEFSALSDPTRLLEKARIEGAALEPGELREIVTMVDRAAEWREIALQPPAAMKSKWAAVEALS